MLGMWFRLVAAVSLAQVTACSFAVVPSQSGSEGAKSAALDCESRSAAPLIDTILAVGFAAATFAAVSSEPEEQEADGASPEMAAVSTLGVGTATTAAFVASAVHGHNSIQSCLALKRGRSPADPGSETKVARADGSRSVMAAGSKLVGPAAAAR
jgi:hypothetical protein